MKTSIKKELKFWILGILFMFSIISFYILLSNDLPVYAYEHLFFAIISAICMGNQLNHY